MKTIDKLIGEAVATRVFNLASALVSNRDTKLKPEITVMPASVPPSVVNVPQQPAPVVNVPAPVVNFPEIVVNVPQVESPIQVTVVVPPESIKIEVNIPDVIVQMPKQEIPVLKEPEEKKITKAVIKRDDGTSSTITLE